MATYRFKTDPYKPYHHQVRALKRLLRKGYLALLWEPGTGKTRAIIDWACAENMRSNVTRVLIVCPFSVMGVWEEEFETFAPIRYHLHMLEIDETSVPIQHGVLNICVVNYDRAWRRDKVLSQFNPDMVIADESHRIKRPNARRSRYMRKWKNAPYRAILTGTPTPKSYIDIYSQWVFLNHRRFGTNFNRFKQKYVIMGGYLGKQIKGYTNVPELKTKIDKDASVILEKDVLDLPPAVFQKVPVFLEDSAMAAYLKMEYELFLELQHGEVSDAKNIAVKILRLQQITGGWLKSDEGNLHQVSDAKIKSCLERLEDVWENDEGLVVFARFRPEVQAIYDLGVRSRVPTYVLRGGMGRQERDEARRKFQAQRGARVFVAQIQSGGLGITLHSASQGIFYSVTHALDDYIQAWRRIRRSGQTKHQRFQHLVVPNSIDTDIYANLRAKKDIMDSIMQDPKKFAAHLKRRIESRHQ